MKITSTVLSIPPYLSTTWENISTLHIRHEGPEAVLVVTLQSKIQVEIPRLEQEEIDAIFEAHTRFCETKEPAKKTSGNPLEGPFSFSLPLKGPAESLGAAMQHNPDQADLPPLDPDILQKITMIARAFGLEDTSLLPPAEPHCNCVYCQVYRGLHTDSSSTESAEEVTEADLTFKNWDIEQTGDKMYLVSNPLDVSEHYSVFLGTPLGCTCGEKNCEHIRSVLST